MKKMLIVRNQVKRMRLRMEIVMKEIIRDLWKRNVSKFRENR